MGCRAHVRRPAPPTLIIIITVAVEVVVVVLLLLNARGNFSINLTGPSSTADETTTAKKKKRIPLAIALYRAVITILLLYQLPLQAGRPVSTRRHCDNLLRIPVHLHLVIICTQCASTSYTYTKYRRKL